MPKLIGLFRRREGTTPVQFRDYYETRHAPLAISLYGDLFAAYSRNYVDHDLGAPDPEGSASTTIDVVTEIEFGDQESMDAMFARAADDPAVRNAITQDEEVFMDRSATRLLIVGEHPEGGNDAPRQDERRH